MQLTWGWILMTLSIGCVPWVLAKCHDWVFQLLPEMQQKKLRIQMFVEGVTQDFRQIIIWFDFMWKGVCFWNFERFMHCWSTVDPLWDVNLPWLLMCSTIYGKLTWHWGTYWTLAVLRHFKSTHTFSDKVKTYEYNGIYVSYSLRISFCRWAICFL